MAGGVANLRGSAPNIGTYARPNIVGDPFTAGPVAANPGCAAPTVVGNTAKWFNPCAFTVPAGSFGNLGRNAFRGHPDSNVDFSMFKSVPLPREGWTVQLCFEAFKVLNIQNWDVPSGLTIGNANAGQITGLAPGTSPRQLQFGLRFQFWFHADPPELRFAAGSGGPAATLVGWTRHPKRIQGCACAR